MATYFLSPISSILQYFTDVGVVLSGGKINTYLAGSSTPTPTWTDSTGTVQNGNPITLLSNGRLPNVQVWQLQGVSLKIVITDANNNPIGPTFDQVSGINDPTNLQTLLANPATGFGSDFVANAMRSYDIVSSVRAANAPVITGSQTLVIDVQGGAVYSDGGGGIFYWNATSSATDDGVNVIKPNSVSGNGRYLRQYSKVLNTTFKTANLSRANTQTYANDPDLSITLGSTGYYKVELFLLFNCTTTQTQGFKAQLSGTATASGTGAGYQFGTGTFINLPALNIFNNTIYGANADITGITDFVYFQGIMNVTVSGTVVLQWAQNSATGQANNTTVYSGSYLSVNKIG